MPKLLFNLEEEESLRDSRSNEIAYVLTVENVGTKSVELESLQTRIPSLVELSEIKNPTSVALVAKYNQVCKQFGKVLNSTLLVGQKDFRDRYVQVQKEIFGEMVDILRGNLLMSVLRLYSHLLTGRYVEMVAKSKLTGEAYTEKIENLVQAKAAFSRWFSVPGQNFEEKILQSKLEEMERLEKEMTKDTKLSSLATLEPDSVFSQTYVFKFDRNSWTPKKYNISIDGTYYEKLGADGNPVKRFSGSASVCPTISPKPTMLTILAVSASILGAIMKYSVEVSGKELMVPTSWEQLTTAAKSQSTTIFFLNVIVGAITSLIFFNVYEYTSLGKNLVLGISWRSALLIGALCGLFGDKIFAALKLFVS